MATIEGKTVKNEFEENGYYVLRGVLTEMEVDRLARPIRAAFARGDYDTFRKGPAYPSPGIHSMGPRVLEDHPEIAELSLAHPKIMAAVEELFGEPATLSQYWSIMRPPGAGLGDKPVGGVDEGRLLIEDSDEKVLVLGNDTDGWRLPKYAASEDASAGILDVCNVMGSVVTQARDQLGLQLPWLSWLADLTDPAPDGDTDQWRCRVYGHRLPTAAPALDTEEDLTGQHRWMSADELASVNSAGLLEVGAEVLKWLRMWQNEEDEDGQPVTRGYGVPTTDVAYYSYNRNGNPEGTYRIGKFDQDGRPVPV